jgi:hypothetical protein
MRENDFKEKCMYCHRVLVSDDWRSHFSAQTHYKTMKCECGKLNKIKVDFVGSGHDTWHAKKVELASKPPLEVQVKAMSK